MDRRKVLLAVAAVIAALGTLLVFLYVRGADTRADQRYEAVQVLRVVKQIDPGETVEAAQAAGKIETELGLPEGPAPRRAHRRPSRSPARSPSRTIYPGEQLISSKFGATGAAASGLTIPKGKIAISVNLTDPSRVAGFVNPGDKVAIFMTGTGGATAAPSAGCCCPTSRSSAPVRRPWSPPRRPTPNGVARPPTSCRRPC